MSLLFQPFRAVGLVCGEARPVLNSLGTENFLTVAVGSSFHVYSCDRLSLRIASEPLPEDIQCVNAMAADTSVCGSCEQPRSLALFHHLQCYRCSVLACAKEITLAGAGDALHVFRRLRRVCEEA